MRIIGGTHRGRNLSTLRGFKYRPMLNQLRQTLFDILSPTIEGAAFLDLYAGTGSVGLEALSRGASEAVFVESHRPAGTVIEKNLANLKLTNGQVLGLSVSSALGRLRFQEPRFDVVFLAPPYKDEEEYEQSLEALGRPGLVRAEGRVIAQHSRRLELRDFYGELRRTRNLLRGESQLTFYGYFSSET